MNKKAFYLALAIPAALVAFFFLTLLFTPNDAIKGVLVRAADSAGYTLDVTKLHKGFPVGLKADALVLSNDKGPLLKLRDARVRLKLLPLLTGKVKVAFRGAVGAGEIEGDADLWRTKGWSLQCRRVRLEDIPFFTTVAGARVTGEMSVTGKMALKNNIGDGDIQLEVKGAELAGVKVGVMPLPDAAYRSVRGALRVEKGRAQLKSFTLDGDGIYVRLKGDTMLTEPVGDSNLNLTLEMMPKPAFLERQKFVFLLLTKYQTSPGAFSVPIRGTLAHPSI